MKNFPIKAIMIDSARVMEQRHVYSELLPLFAQWGYNTLFWHFCDDQGCRLRFPSHPEFGSFNAWNAEETRDFVEEAKAFGLQVIPEIETLGHTSFITGLDQYQHLQDGIDGAIFSAIAPCHPETRALLEDIVRDTAEIFDAPYLHIGMDEAAFGNHAHTREVLKTKSKGEVITGHICWLHELLKSLGKRTVLWGDHLRPHPEDDDIFDKLDNAAIGVDIADKIPKDCIICDWHYQEDVASDRFDVFLTRGFEVLACPASSSWSLIVHPAQRNLENVRKMIDLTVKHPSENMLGCVNTVWCSGRYLNGTLLYAEALGAHLMNHESKHDDFDTRFVEECFASDDPLNIVKAIHILHETGPWAPSIAGAVPACEEAWRKLTDDEKEKITAMEQAGTEAQALLQSAEPGVKRRHEYYLHLLLAAKCYEHLGRGTRILEPLRSVWAEEKKVTDLSPIKDWLTENGELVEALSEAWDTQRFADDPAKYGAGQPGCDYILERLYHSGVFIQKVLNKI